MGKCNSSKLNPTLCLMVLMPMVVGCGESAQQAMIRVAKERAAFKEREEKADSGSGVEAPKVVDVAPTPTPSVTEATIPMGPVPAASVAEIAGEVGKKKPRVSKQHPASIDHKRIDCSDIYTIEGNRGPLTNEEKWKRSIKSMQRIAEAINEMHKEGEVLSDLTDDKGKPLLSWRVALLPYLGFPGLYRQFRLDEPWNSVYNNSLLFFIPDPYLDVEDYSKDSPYVAVHGSKLAFNEDTVLDIDSIKDGAEVTLMIADTGNLFHVPWSKPEDLYIAESKDLKSLYMTRWVGSIVGITAAGEVVRFPDGGKNANKWSAFTAAGEDGPGRDFFDFLDANSPYEKVPIVAAVSGDDALVSTTPGKTRASSNKTSRIAPPPNLGMALPPANFFALPPAVRLPMPKTSEITKSQKILQGIYADRLKTIKTPADRIAFGEDLFREGQPMVNDGPGGYALFSASRTLALAAGDFDLMMKATDQIIDRFDVDPFEERREWIESYGKLLRLPNGVQPKIGNAGLVTVNLLRWAVEKDNYKAAKSIIEVLSHLGRRSDAGLNYGDINLLKTLVDQSSVQFGRCAASVNALANNPNDVNAAQRVGSYLCFVKGDWLEGMPMLAKGSGRTSDLVARELSIEPEVDAYLAIADEWYDIAASESDELQKQGALARASLWYKHLVPFLDGSLQKLQVTVRLKELGTTHSSLYDALGKILIDLGGPQAAGG